MASKFYLFDNRPAAQSLVDVLTAAYGENIPYTEIRESNNGKGFAVKDGDWTLQHTDLVPEYLPEDFYIDVD